MAPGTFDTIAGTALLVLLPASVLFAAAALRRLRPPRWSWVLFAVGIVGVLWLLHLAGDTRYPVGDESRPYDQDRNWSQWVGLGLGRLGVAVNGGVAAVVGVARRRRPPSLQLTGREARLAAGAYLALAVATALPATWWAIGLGLPPAALVVPFAVVGAGLLATALTLRWRRLGRLEEDDRPDVVSLWPADATVGVGLAVLLVVATVSQGSGPPDAGLLPVVADPATPTAAATPAPEWPGPVPVTSTTRSPAAIESGTRALLEDTIGWARPLDDLSSPTPAAATPPAVVLTPTTCPEGGRRWTGSLVLPSVRPQDTAPRVLRGWVRSGYAAVDRGMGTDLVMPLTDVAAVERMRLGGGLDGVHVDVESFCVPA